MGSGHVPASGQDVRYQRAARTLDTSVEAAGRGGDARACLEMEAADEFNRAVFTR
jgi:hypothetical protein